MLYLSHNNGLLSSLIFNGKELLNASSPLFRICLRSKSGETVIICSNGADSILQDGDKTVFSGFSLFVTVFLRIENRDGKIKAYAEIKNDTDYAVEWVILLPLKLKPLCGDGGEAGAQLILPYNEGLLLDSVKKIPGIPPEYPSSGGCLMFPNMMFAQTASYLFKNGGSGCYLNIYTPDEKRSPKEITVRDGELIFKQFCGADFGCDVSIPYPLILQSGEGGWENSFTDYRKWLELDLSNKAKKVSDNKTLPRWYTG